MSHANASQATTDEVPCLSAGDRVVALGVGVSLLAPFAVLAFMTPAEAGLGTHTTLGLPGCSWPTALGLPCPSCGYTTAFTHAAHGDLVQSFVTQPAGFALAMASVTAAVVALGCAASAQPWHRLFAPLATKPVVWIGAGMFVAGWGYKIGSFKGWW
ncbi:MAG: DUF2752 domain-containing protein [Planctomycetota bacterium]|nr:DUF2752 domain-containing protein [Planctomycetota bacterium]